MTQSELLVKMQAIGVMPWVHTMFYDSSYASVTTNWLFNKFVPWFKENRWRANRSKWTRKNDCDNTARRFACDAQDAHADTSQPDEAVAVGEFGYHARTNVATPGPHLINIVDTEEGLIFVEPQTGERRALTPDEISSCFHVAF